MHLVQGGRITCSRSPTGTTLASRLHLGRRSCAHKRFVHATGVVTAAAFGVAKRKAIRKSQEEGWTTLIDLVPLHSVHRDGATNFEAASGRKQKVEGERDASVVMQGIWKSDPYYRTASAGRGGREPEGTGWILPLLHPFIYMD